jgi:broad specificity phosphatase PhoE
VAAELVRRGARVERVVAGSLRRQLDTAWPIARALGIEVEVDERFDEYSTTDILEHHSTTDAREERSDPDAAPISSRDFQGILEAALLEWIDADGAGPTREPWPAFAARVAGAVDGALAGLGRGGVTVAVTSGGPIGATCARLLGTGPASMVAFNRVVTNAGLSAVTAGRGGETLVSFNEHGHLLGGDPALLTYR